MAKANIEVIAALRQTVENLKNNEPYQWGHMGACNCGHLARVVTPFTKAEIHSWAVAKQEGDWSEMLNDYCATSNAPFDMVIAMLLNAGFSVTDLHELEYLSNDKILKRLNVHMLNRNSRVDVISYIETWVAILEEKYINDVTVNFNYALSIDDNM